MSALFEVEDLVVRYGQAVAVDGVSLRVARGERVALIGPNGAGKTSLLNAACGVIRPASGRVRVEGDDVTGATPAALVRRGVTQVPEGRHVFASLPVEANLQVGAYGRSSASTFSARHCGTSGDGPTSVNGSNASTPCFRSCASCASAQPDAPPEASSRWWRSGGR